MMMMMMIDAEDMNTRGAEATDHREAKIDQIEKIKAIASRMRNVKIGRKDAMRTELRRHKGEELMKIMKEVDVIEAEVEVMNE